MVTKLEINKILAHELHYRYGGRPDPSNKRRIVADVRVSINTENYSWDGGAGPYDELIVEFLTTTPRGKNKKWVPVKIK